MKLNVIFVLSTIFLSSMSFANPNQTLFKSIQSCKFDMNDDGMLFFEIAGKSELDDPIISTNLFDMEMMNVCQAMIFKVMDEPEKYDLKIHEGNEYFCQLIRE